MLNIPDLPGVESRMKPKRAIELLCAAADAQLQSMGATQEVIEERLSALAENAVAAYENAIKP